MRDWLSWNHVRDMALFVGTAVLAGYVIAQIIN